MVLLILWVDLQTSKCPSPGMLLEITHSHASRPEVWCIRVKLSGFKTRHSGSAEATWRVSVPPAARSSAPAHDARRECQLHVTKSTSFPRKSGNSDICANTLICKWWQVMSFSFLLNTMQPSSLGHHFATSALGILRGEERCSKMFLPHSPQGLFLSALSHSEGHHKKQPPFHWEGYELWRKWKVGPLKTQIQPLPSCLWIEPYVI